MWDSSWLFLTLESVLFCETVSYHVYLLFLQGTRERMAFVAVLMLTWEKAEFTESLSCSSWEQTLKITQETSGLLSLSSAGSPSPSPLTLHTDENDVTRKVPTASVVYKSP